MARRNFDTASDLAFAATRGVRVTLLGATCALAWAATAAVYVLGYAVKDSRTPESIMLLGLLAIGPALLILFSALAAREAVRARALAERVCGLTEAAILAPSPQTIAQTRALATELRSEVEALDSIVLVTAKRLEAFESGLRADGGLLARALAEDVETIGRVRNDLNEETAAVGEAISAHVAQLRTESRAAIDELDSQIQVFGELSAKIGARSAEFAAAAQMSSGSSGLLDAAVDKALSALAHATSLTDTARKSAEEAAMVAQEAAGAVRGATRNAIAEARDATKRIREQAMSLPRLFTGPAKDENVTPPAASLAHSAAKVTTNVIEMPRVSLKAEALKLDLQPANEHRPLTLAEIVNASGLSITGILTPEGLDHISQAAKRGPDARRAMVRAVAPQALKKISAYLRRDAHARREAEMLRREPARALGGENESESRRRDFASAFLLIDTVLG